MEKRMSAKIAPGFNYERQKLADIVPLPTPFTFLIAPAHVCNFRCHYCSHGQRRKEMKEEGFEFKLMDYEIVETFAKQLREFPERLKLIFFSGMGEPLMHRRIAEMVACLREHDVAERLEIFTNGKLLTKEMSDALVSAGLSRIRVSLQGLSSESYRQTAGVRVDFERLREQLEYFYSVRGECQLYVKVIDSALEEGEEEKFFEMFEDKCDQMYVERFVPYQVSLGDYGDEACMDKTVYGDDVIGSNMCPEPFFNWQLGIDGEIYPCCPLGLPRDFAVGNIRERTVFQMWNGEEARELRLLHLKNQRASHWVCGKCRVYLSKLTVADKLDDDAESLIPLFEK